jgi:hypothetical protein
MNRLLTIAGLWTAFIAATGGAADAGIISLAGQVVDGGQLVSQDLRKDKLVSDNLNVAHLFREQQNFQAASNVRLDVTNTGLVTAPGGAVSGVLSAGTRFNSYFLHYDIFGNGFGTVTGSVTFSEAIIGLQVLDRTLDSCHAIVGQAGVTYQVNSFLDGTLDSPGQDLIRISPDRKTLSFTFAVQPQVDTLRVFTEAPEPSSALLLGMGLAGVAGARLRRNRSRI